MAQPFFFVDAFTDRAFSGNPAVVVPMSVWPSDEWCRLVANEMNQAETAFVVRQSDRDFHLRWWTPQVEVDLCGHATLASAHVLWHLGWAEGTIRFSTRSGWLSAEKAGHLIQLDFPLKPDVEAPPPPGLLEALGTHAEFVGRNQFDYLVVLATEAMLREVAPNFARLGKVECRGIIVTAPSSDPRFDFVSRFFAPAVGINEDPVTGSAHCCLAGYWQRRLGKSSFNAFQASTRGGVLHVEVAGDRVRLAGTAVLVSRGELLV